MLNPKPRIDTILSFLFEVSTYSPKISIGFRLFKIRWFPKRGVPLNHPISGGLSIIHHPAIGEYLFENLHFCIQLSTDSELSFPTKPSVNFSCLGDVAAREGSLLLAPGGKSGHLVMFQTHPNPTRIEARTVKTDQLNRIESIQLYTS